MKGFFGFLIFALLSCVWHARRVFSLNGSRKTDVANDWSLLMAGESMLKVAINKFFPGGSVMGACVCFSDEMSLLDSGRKSAQNRMVALLRQERRHEVALVFRHILRSSGLSAFVVICLWACVFFSKTCSILMWQREDCVLIFVVNLLVLVACLGCLVGNGSAGLQGICVRISSFCVRPQRFHMCQHDGWLIRGRGILTCRSVRTSHGVLRGGLRGLSLYDKRKP